MQAIKVKVNTGNRRSDMELIKMLNAVRRFFPPLETYIESRSRSRCIGVKCHQVTADL